MEDDEEMADDRPIQASIRSAKKAARPTKIGLPENKPTKSTKKKDKSTKRKVTASKGSAFGEDVGKLPVQREGVRAKKGDTIGGMGKKGGKGGKGGGGKRRTK